MSAFLHPGDPGAIVIEWKQPARVSDVCLASLHTNGSLRFLTGAWEDLLGYARAELDGHPLAQVLAGPPHEVVPRLVDDAEPDPVSVEVRAKSGAPRRLNVFRRFDPYEPAIYLACEPFENRRP